MTKIERTAGELYLDDPERADAIVFGRRTGVSRRGFLGGSGMAAMSAAVGAPIVFGAAMPGGLIPAALAQEAKQDTAAAAPPPPLKGAQLLQFPGKDGNLVVLSDRPLVAETPERLLDDETTPTSKFFIRNNGQIPETTTEPDAWKLTIDGEVNKPLELTLGELKAKFRRVTRRMVLECGGNGRSFFIPQARGNQWTNGGAGCAEWTGARLADVIRAAGRQAVGRVQRPLRRRSASVGRCHQERPVARSADQEADGREQPHRLGDERQAAGADARLPAAPRHPRAGPDRSRTSG